LIVIVIEPKAEFCGDFQLQLPGELSNQRKSPVPSNQIKFKPALAIRGEESEF
jgi:hypothetical protein